MHLSQRIHPFSGLRGHVSASQTRLATDILISYGRKNAIDGASVPFFVCASKAMPVREEEQYQRPGTVTPKCNAAIINVTH